MSLDISKRIAAICSLLAFSLSVIVGIEAGNSFATTVQRALIAMVGTLVIGLVIGTMLHRMIEENLQNELKRIQSLSSSEEDTSR